MTPTLVLLALLGIAIAVSVAYRFIRFPQVRKTNLRFMAFAFALYALVIVALELGHVL